MPLRPVERRSASDAVFDQLIAEVLDGGIVPGEALPAERSLTGTLAVNRQAIREALQRLAQSGLVEINHGGPTKVLDFRRSGGLDLLPRLLVSGDGLDPTVARSVVEMRACIGPDVARLAAERASSDLISELGRIVEEMGAQPDPGVVARLDVQFWDLLVDGSGNIAYRLAYNGLRAVYEPVLEFVFPVLQEELWDIVARSSLVRAIQERDPDAAEEIARGLLAKGTAAMSTALEEFQRGAT